MQADECQSLGPVHPVQTAHLAAAEIAQAVVDQHLAASAFFRIGIRQQVGEVRIGGWIRLEHSCISGRRYWTLDRFFC